MAAARKAPLPSFAPRVRGESGGSSTSTGRGVTGDKGNTTRGMGKGKGAGKGTGGKAGEVERIQRRTKSEQERDDLLRHMQEQLNNNEGTDSSDNNYIENDFTPPDEDDPQLRPQQMAFPVKKSMIQPHQRAPSPRQGEALQKHAERVRKSTMLRQRNENMLKVAEDR